MADQEQVIAAELHRSTNGTVDRIVFNGDTYVRRNTVPPPNPNLAGYVGDWDDDDGYNPAPLPPELLTPDPDLMASPEGDVKGLRELQDAARAINEQSSYTGVLHDRDPGQAWVGFTPVRQTDPTGVYSRLWGRLARKSRGQ